jgi:hypothetical protein
MRPSDASPPRAALRAIRSFVLEKLQASSLSCNNENFCLLAFREGVQTAGGAADSLILPIKPLASLAVLAVRRIEVGLVNLPRLTLI